MAWKLIFLWDFFLWIIYLAVFLHFVRNRISLKGIYFCDLQLVMYVYKINNLFGSLFAFCERLNFLKGIIIFVICSKSCTYVYNCLLSKTRNMCIRNGNYINMYAGAGGGFKVDVLQVKSFLRLNQYLI